MAGKLVLVDGEFDDWWLSFVGAEATHRGAAGVVMTYGENTYEWYSYPEALGSNDGEYDDDWVPMVYVAWRDGDWIKAQLEAAGGTIDATMTSDVEITLAEDDGTGVQRGRRARGQRLPTSRRCFWRPTSTPTSGPAWTIPAPR